MNKGAFITVTRGIHSGASVPLSDGQDVTIGSEEDANLVLVDDGIVPHHATVCLSGDLLRLIANHDGVSVFGNALAPGKPAMLKRGAVFAIGGAHMQFSGADPLTPDEIRAAELAWLSTHAPVTHIARRWEFASRGFKATLVVIALVAAGAAIWQTYAPRKVETSMPKLEGPYSHVTVRQDPKTRAYIYEGYVATAPELSSLSASIRRDMCSAVIRVVVVEQMQEQLADFLQKYYRGAQIRRGTGGSLMVVPPAQDGYLLPESWDYRGIARLAMASVKGLHDIQFEGQTLGDGPVQAPLAALGMNIERAANGAWLIDAKGVRYFPGAQLPFGKITSISDCLVTLVRNDDGVEYRFRALDSDGRTRCK